MKGSMVRVASAGFALVIVLALAFGAPAVSHAAGRRSGAVMRPRAVAMAAGGVVVAVMVVATGAVGHWGSGWWGGFYAFPYYYPYTSAYPYPTYTYDYYSTAAPLTSVQTPASSAKSSIRTASTSCTATA